MEYANPVKSHETKFCLILVYEKFDTYERDAIAAYIGISRKFHTATASTARE